MKKINLEDINDKFIIVVDGEEKKIVYEVDDERIFGTHVTGCGRGARNAVLSRKTFKTLDESLKAIKYLDSCFWNCNFKFLTVEKFRNDYSDAYTYLLKDIESFNWSVDFTNKFEKEEQKKREQEYTELKNQAINLVTENFVKRIETNENGDLVIIIQRS